MKLFGVLFLGMMVAQPPLLCANAEVSTDALSQVRAYPVPWRSDQHTGIDVSFAPFLLPATVKIFTIAGEHVQTLEGTGTVHWDLKNRSGSQVASGVYIYLVTSNNLKKTGKLVVIR